MIRDISIIVVIFAIVLFSHNYVQGELKNNSEELLSRLDELKVQMQNESDNKDAIKEIDRKASIDENVIRHLIIKLDEE